MSAVSAESPRGSADLSTSASSAQATGEPSHNGPAHNGPARNGTAAQADFGPNQWLVDELYQRYQADPGSVDQAWWSFFADYHPQPDSAPASPAEATALDAAAGQPVAAATAPADRPGEQAGTCRLAAGARRRERAERTRRRARPRCGSRLSASQPRLGSHRLQAQAAAADAAAAAGAAAAGAAQGAAAAEQWCGCAARRRAQPRI